MKLTEQHIQDLYKFTRQHYVEFYDIQTELVDHLANDIEQIWQEKPTLAFEEARDMAFKKFGVFGFMNVLEEKQKAMNKKYRKIMWRFAKEWFQLPKIIITFSSVYFLFLLFSSSIGVYAYYTIYAVLFGFILIKYRQLRKISKERQQKSGKKWMLEHMIYTTASSNIFVFVVNTINIVNSSRIVSSTKNLDNFYVALGFSVVFVIAFLLAHITLSVIPKKGEELLAETYPAYKLANTL